MAKSELKKQKVRLISGIVVLALTTLALVTSTLAWFLTGKETEVHTFDLQTDGAYNLQISPTDKDNWAYELKFDDDHQLQPVTGDGINFFTPVFGMQEKEEGSGVFFSSPTGYESIREDLLPDYVFPIDFKVQIESDCDLLIEDFFVEMPSGEWNTNFETGQYGVSKSLLLGAVRIAVLEKTEEGYITRFLWVPDQTNALITTKDGYNMGTHSEFEDLILQTGPTLEERTVIEAPQGDAPSDMMYGTGIVEATESAPKVRFGGKDEDVTEDDGSFDRIGCYFDPANSDDNILSSLKGKEEKQFRVVVWIDGNDNECNNVLMGGEIHVGMKLGIAAAEA